MAGTLLGANLVDHPGHVLGGRLGKVRRLDRADDRHAIDRRKVGPRVMVGEQLAVLRGDARDRRLDGRVQRLDAGLQRRVVGGVVVGIGRIPFRQRLFDDLGIAQGMEGIRPEVWVWAARLLWERRSRRHSLRARSSGRPT